MKIGYIQFRPSFGQKEKNLQRILKLLEQAADRYAELIVLPELCNSGYVFRSIDEVQSLSEKVPEGQTTIRFENAAKELGLNIVAGVCEKSNGVYFNSAILVSPQGFSSIYRKAHLFNEEKLWFSKGNTPFEVHNLSKARIGIMICFDWFFPEVTRILSLRGAQIICHPSNIVLPYCQTSMLGAAVQNKVFVVTANRVGRERGMTFTGRSQIVSPEMEVLVRSGKTKEEVKIVEVDPRNSDSKMITARNDVWHDRRIELYQPLVD